MYFKIAANITLARYYLTVQQTSLFKFQQTFFNFYNDITLQLPLTKTFQHAHLALFNLEWWPTPPKRSNIFKTKKM